MLCPDQTHLREGPLLQPVVPSLKRLTALDEPHIAVTYLAGIVFVGPSTGLTGSFLFGRLLDLFVSSLCHSGNQPHLGEGPLLQPGRALRVGLQQGSSPSPTCWGAQVVGAACCGAPALHDGNRVGSCSPNRQDLRMWTNFWHHLKEPEFPDSEPSIQL